MALASQFYSPTLHACTLTLLNTKKPTLFSKCRLFLQQDLSQRDRDVERTVARICADNVNDLTACMSFECQRKGFTKSYRH